MKIITAILLTTLLLGCSSTTPEPCLCDECLTDSVSARLEDQRIAALLLEAEEAFEAGRQMEAMDAVTELYAETKDPRAAEVFGKFALKSARFKAALVMFNEALATREEGSADFQRIADLISLTRGLLAYEAGDLTAAQDCFDRIEDQEIATALADARSATAQ